MLFLAGECGRGGGVWWAWRWCWRLWLGVVAGAAVTAATVVHGAVALWGGGGWKLAEFGWRRLCGTGRFPAWGHADGGGGGSGCCLAGVDPLSPACRRGGGSRWWRWRRRVLFVGGAVGRQVRGSGGVAGGMLRGGFVGRVICVGGMLCVGSGGGRCTGVGAVFFYCSGGRSSTHCQRYQTGQASPNVWWFWKWVASVWGAAWGRTLQADCPLCHTPAHKRTGACLSWSLLLPGLLLQAPGRRLGCPLLFFFPSPLPPIITPPSSHPHAWGTLSSPSHSHHRRRPSPRPFPPPPPDAPSLPTIETRCDGWQIDDGSTK